MSQMRVVPQQAFLDTIQGQREAISVARLMEANTIHLDLPEAEGPQILIPLVSRMKQSGILADEELFFRQLVEREKIMSTGLGQGIAVPHPRTPGLPPVIRSGIAFGYCPKGIDYHSLDGEKTHLFFVIASSTDPIHVRVMSSLVRIASSPGFLEKITQIQTAQEFLELMFNEETRIKG